ncbi:MAG: MFS transporter [Chloroflexota bacterium]|nr:MFS transporter [Chloroflexota bacterium]
MDTSTSNVQPAGRQAQSAPADLPPLCCTATTPAPGSWETGQRLSHFLHGEHHLARRSSYIAVAYTMTAVAIGLNLLTPLYGLYRQQFAFSALTLTLIFAAYVVTIIPAMLIFGPLADAIGRRQILLIAVLAAAAGSLLLLAASGTPWLFAARIVQGVAQGAISGAASAALIELGSDLKKTALVIGMTVTGGIALGPIFSGVLAQYAPAPLKLPFLVYLVLLVPALLCTLWMREPLLPADRRAFRPHRPSLPAKGTQAFLISTAVAAFGFAASALFLSVMPSFLVLLLHTTNIALLTAPVGLFLAASPLVQLLLHNLPARRAAVIGLLLEVIGLLGTLVTATMGSLPLLLVAAVIGGGGSGLAYLGSLSLINQLIPKEQRGDVFGTYYALCYLSLGVTAIVVGLLTAPLGLTIAVRWVSAAVMALCLLTVLAVMRMAPTQA